MLLLESHQDGPKTDGQADRWTCKTPFSNNSLAGPAVSFVRIDTAINRGTTSVIRHNSLITF